MREMIQRTGLTIAEISERTGVGASYLKQMSSQRRRAGPDLAAKLAPFFLDRARELRDEAPRVAAQMEADAAFLESGAQRLRRIAESPDAGEADAQQLGGDDE